MCSISFNFTLYRFLVKSERTNRIGAFLFLHRAKIEIIVNLFLFFGNNYLEVKKLKKCVSLYIIYINIKDK